MVDTCQASTLFSQVWYCFLTDDLLFLENSNANSHEMKV